jgi:iron complex outermembrane recepter protein
MSKYGKSLRGILLASTSILAVLQVGPVRAQAQQPGVAQDDLEQVVVTAQRTAERLQDVPMSVIAISQAKLTEQNITNVNDLEIVAPGLSIFDTTGNRGGTTYAIRGQGAGFGGPPGVISYFAEVPNFSNFLYDLVDVEVLKGPQGTLFGHVSEGGAVLFAPHKPTENEFNGYADVRLGDYSRHDFEFALGGAIIPDKVLFRVSGESLRADGFTTNIATGQKLDNEDRESFRVSVVVKPWERFENYTLFQYDRINEDGTGFILKHIVENPDNASVFPQLQGYLAQQQAIGPRHVDIDTSFYGPPYNYASQVGGINTTTFEATDFLTLKNIYSYRGNNGSDIYSIDSTPLNLLLVSNGIGGDPATITWSEEAQAQWKARLDGVNLNGVLGYYHDVSRRNGPSVGFDILEFVGFTIRAASLGLSSFSQTTGYFGQVDAKFLDDKLSVVAGIRRNDASSNSFGQTIVLFPAFVPGGTGITGPLPPPTNPSLSTSNSPPEYSWNGSVEYKFTPDLNGYVSVRRGYKPGGVNGLLPPPYSTFNPETNTDYEGGVKTSQDIGDWKIQANVDVFYDKYNNIQRFSNTSTVPAATYTNNVGNGTIYGTDLEFTVAPSPLFDVTVQYTYLHTGYDSWVDPVLGNLKGNKFPNAPTSQLSITPTIHFPTPEAWGRTSAHATVYYQSMVCGDPYNVPNGNPVEELTVPDACYSGYTRLDLRADWTKMFGSGFSSALYLKNATNKLYVVGTDNQLNAASGTGVVTYGAPRMWGVEFRYAF